MNRRNFLAALTATAAVAASPAWSQDTFSGASNAPSLADRLADYTWRLRYRDLDAQTIETAKAHLIDALGCAIAAFDAAPVRMCRAVASRAQGMATLIGTQQHTLPELAAFANGAAMRYYDLNDLYAGREPGHPSDNITSCIAVAEAQRGSGQDLLLAIVIAYEIDCRLLDAAEITSRGWDHPTYSLPASALAAGKLLALDRTQLAQAVNLSISGHIAMNQTRVQQLSDWKGIADAEAARNGVFAAQLAQAGLTGPSPIFEGRAGFFKQISGAFDLDIEQFGGRHGTFRINECAIKPYPAQGYTLTAIPAAIDVARQASGDLTRVRTIEVATTHAGYVTAGREPEKWTPETRETADHSLPFVVARAMLDGDITNDSYSLAAIRDPAVRALMKKITVVADPKLTALQPRALPNRITVTLDDGRVLVRQVDALPGFAGQPVSRADTERKFGRNVSRYWGDAQTREVLDVLWKLDGRDTVTGLMELLAIRS